MDIRQLKYFASVAKNLNFTKAAKENFIAQTAMSQHILALEKKLGVELFIRNNRSVKLTPAGEVLFKEVGIILDSLEVLFAKTRQAAQGHAGNLTIGYWGPQDKVLLTGLVKVFAQRFPTIHLDFHQSDLKAVVNGLETGLFDCIFTSPFLVEHNPEITYMKIDSSPLGVLTNREHVFAKKKIVLSCELKDEKFIIIDVADFPGVLENLVDKCRKMGFTPHIVHRPPTFEILFVLVEAGMGITLISLNVQNELPANLVFHSIKQAENIDVCVAWLKHNPNPALPMFLETYKELIAI